MFIKSILLTFILVLLLIPCRAQETTGCPKIKVIASNSQYDPGETVPFSVSITENPNNLKLEYYWDISAGAISGGQGTASINVYTAGLGSTTVTATVKIKGLPINCEKEYSANVTIKAMPPIRDPDEFQGPQTRSEIKARLDALYFALHQKPTYIAIIINYGTDKQVAVRIAQILRVVRERKFDKNRLKFVRGGSEPGIRTQFWISPKTETGTFKP